MNTTTAATATTTLLSVINLQDLPLDIQPLLLRDNPTRQTSTSQYTVEENINSYRGVCRVLVQSRKKVGGSPPKNNNTDHDDDDDCCVWQSSICFDGVNHWLGTFDSEWDAAAIYGK